MKRWSIAASLVIVSVLVAGLVLVSPYVTTNPNPLSNNGFLTKGHVTYYAFGGALVTPIALTQSYRFTGGFDTNSSVIFYVMSSQQYESQSPEFKSPVSYYYSTGNVKSAVINTTIFAGNYDFVFRFVNNTGKLVTTFNGTGLASITTLTITQTFVLTPIK